MANVEPKKSLTVCGKRTCMCSQIMANLDRSKTPFFFANKNFTLKNGPELPHEFVHEHGHEMKTIVTLESAGLFFAVELQILTKGDQNIVRMGLGWECFILGRNVYDEDLLFFTLEGHSRFAVIVVRGHSRRKEVKEEVESQKQKDRDTLVSAIFAKQALQGQTSKPLKNTLHHPTRDPTIKREGAVQDIDMELNSHKETSNQGYLGKEQRVSMHSKLQCLKSIACDQGLKSEEVPTSAALKRLDKVVRRCSEEADPQLESGGPSVRMGNRVQFNDHSHDHSEGEEEEEDDCNMCLLRKKKGLKLSVTSDEEDDFEEEEASRHHVQALPKRKEFWLEGKLPNIFITKNGKKMPIIAKKERKFIAAWGRTKYKELIETAPPGKLQGVLYEGRPVWKWVQTYGRLFFAALYTEEEYKNLTIEAHVFCRRAELRGFANRFPFFCKFCDEDFKDKNGLNSHRIRDKCPIYKGPEPLKMYPVWTASQRSELNRICKEKGLKILPSIPVKGKNLGRGDAEKRSLKQKKLGDDHGGAQLDPSKSTYRTRSSQREITHSHVILNKGKEVLSSDRNGGARSVISARKVDGLRISDPIGKVRFSPRHQTQNLEMETLGEPRNPIDIVESPHQGDDERKSRHKRLFKRHFDIKQVTRSSIESGSFHILTPIVIEEKPSLLHHDMKVSQTPREIVEDEARAVAATFKVKKQAYDESLQHFDNALQARRQKYISNKLREFDIAELVKTEEALWSWSPFFQVMKRAPLAHFPQSPWKHTEDEWHDVMSHLYTLDAHEPKTLEEDCPHIIRAFKMLYRVLYGRGKALCHPFVGLTRKNLLRIASDSDLSKQLTQSVHDLVRCGWLWFPNFTSCAESVEECEKDLRGLLGYDGYDQDAVIHKIEVFMDRLSRRAALDMDKFQKQDALASLWYNLPSTEAERDKVDQVFSAMMLYREDVDIGWVVGAFDIKDIPDGLFQESLKDAELALRRVRTLQLRVLATRKVAYFDTEL